MFGPRAVNQDIVIHPLAFAGWVGIFITALNLIPIGQLDGGHVLYALLRTKAHFVAQLLLVCAIVAVVFSGNWGWSLMLALLLYMGPNHPPTANDDEPLGTGRTVLGWLTLMFIFIGFTPRPFF
jgi:membrane-associated protease RseP (regulator of RpoE activity)